ncbi:flagellar motor protein MotD [Niveibacterium sp. SC-1]|uniref:flagellar motor protein MotD n=1 Tax=Niveibacterium sp. SC-1 TaxID=3135646 RepID=UPI00311F1670
MAGRRRKHEEEHENHERWLVSYADFITLLFAFFVVMYAISSINEGKYRVLSNSLVNAFRSVDTNAEGMQVAPRTAVAATVPAVKQPKTQADPREEARKRLRRQMQDMAEQVRRVLAPLVREGRVTINDGPYGISIEINASVLFNPGEAVLGNEAARAMRAIGEVLSQGDFPVKVEGHTDTSPIANSLFASNWELSAVRAATVVRTFIDARVDPRRLTAAGYADQRPVADNSTPEGRARNRRVAILIESMLPPEANEAAPASVTGSAPAEGAVLGAPMP